MWPFVELHGLVRGLANPNSNPNPYPNADEMEWVMQVSAITVDRAMQTFAIAKLQLRWR